jgi:soluble lytic murein transglycosylase-like protein
MDVSICRCFSFPLLLITLAGSAYAQRRVFRADLVDAGLLRAHRSRRRPLAGKNVRATHGVRRLAALTRHRPRTMSPAERRRLVDETVAAEAARYQIDPLLIHAIIAQESGGSPNALSPKGALGLMQLMPKTARRFGVRDRRDIPSSIRGGVQYLVYLLDRYHGDVRLSLAGYNAGEARVDRAGGIPHNRETPRYVRAVEARYLKLVRDRAAVRESPAVASTEREEMNTIPLSTPYVYRFRASSGASRSGVLGIKISTLAP